MTFDKTTDLDLQNSELRNYCLVLQKQRFELMRALKTAVERQGFTNEELIESRELIKRTYGSW